MDELLWSTVDISHFLPKQISSAFALPHCSDDMSSLYYSLQHHIRTLIVSNPHYLQGSDIACLLRSLSSPVPVQEHDGEKSFEESKVVETAVYTNPEFSMSSSLTNTLHGPILTELRLENYPSISTASLAMFLQKTPAKLKVLSLHGTQIPSSVVRSLKSNKRLCESLEELNMSFTSSTSDTVYLLADCDLRRLSSLHLAGNLSISGESIHHLLRILSEGFVFNNEVKKANISRLDFRFIWGFEAYWFVDFFKRMDNKMEVLDIRGCEHFTKRDIANMLAVSPQTVVLNSVLLEDDTVEGYRRFVSLLTQPKLNCRARSTTEVCTDLATAAPNANSFSF